MEASPLNRLPPELRDRIYEYVVTPGKDPLNRLTPNKETRISINVSRGRPLARDLDLRYFRICRQMREEISEIFYSKNIFTIITKYLDLDSESTFDQLLKPFSGFSSWLEKIGKKNVAHLTHICIDLGWLTVESDHSLITSSLSLAATEIQQLLSDFHIPPRVLVLRAAYFIEVFPPIAHVMRYIDVPVGDEQAAKSMLENVTQTSKEKMPPYAFNRDVVYKTMDLFRDGVLAICVDV